MPSIIFSVLLGVVTIGVAHAVVLARATRALESGDPVEIRRVAESLRSIGRRRQADVMDETGWLLENRSNPMVRRFLRAASEKNFPEAYRIAKVLERPLLMKMIAEASAKGGK